MNMTNVAKWPVGIGVGLVVAIGLVNCSDSSSRTEEAAAGTGPGGGSAAGSGASSAGAGGSAAGSGGASAGTGGSAAGSGGSSAGTGGSAAGSGGASAGSGGSAAGSGGASAGSGGSAAGSGGSSAGAGGIPSETEEVRSELPHDTTPDVADGDYQAFISNTNSFGLRVFDELTTGDANVVFSPVSVAVALGMTYAGARHDTATQMAAAMQNDLSDEAFHAANNRLALELASRNIAPHETDGGEKSLRLRLVNASWAQSGYPIEQPFLDILSTNYDAGMKLLDFIGNTEGSRQIINEWVADQTEDKIEDLIGPGALSPDTKLVLTNALYFYGSWQAVFDENATSDGTYYTLFAAEVTAEMMHQSSGFPYAEGDGYQMLDLPYDGNELAMTIVLPEAGRFSEIRDALSSDWLQQARASISNTQVAVTMPKFSFTWGTESLKEPLIALGMTDAFQPDVADLTGISTASQLFIFDVLHQAFIAVDESGTEAAAATAVIIADTSLPPTPVPFTVDRPFLFFIRDSSGLLLFVGQVTDPTA
jgi:serpin B